MTNKLKLVIFSVMTLIMTLAPIDARAASFTAAPGPNVIKQASGACWYYFDWLPGSTVMITPTMTMCSPNRKYTAIYQGDGNWVVYYYNKPIWYSNTAGNYNSTLVFQPDRNIVIYRANGTPAWSTGTYVTGDHGFYFRRLIMQDDGNLVYYEQRNSLIPVWSSKTGKL